MWRERLVPNTAFINSDIQEMSDLFSSCSEHNA